REDAAAGDGTEGSCVRSSHLAVCARARDRYPRSGTHVSTEITESGRETMLLSERIDLLRSDLMAEPFLGMENARALSQEIHDLKFTIAWVRGVIDLYDRRRSEGIAEERLQAGAYQVVSPAECWVLAWRRGGHREWKRVVQRQRELSTQE